MKAKDYLSKFIEDSGSADQQTIKMLNSIFEAINESAVLSTDQQSAFTDSVMRARARGESNELTALLIATWINTCK